MVKWVVNISKSPSHLRHPQAALSMVSHTAATAAVLLCAGLLAYATVSYVLLYAKDEGHQLLIIAQDRPRVTIVTGYWEKAPLLTTTHTVIFCTPDLAPMARRMSTAVVVTGVDVPRVQMLSRAQKMNPFNASIFLWVDFELLLSSAWPTNLLPFREDKVLLNNVEGAVSPETCPSKRYCQNGRLYTKLVRQFFAYHQGVSLSVFGGTSRAVQSLERAYQDFEAAEKEEEALTAISCCYPDIVKLVVPRGGTTLLHYVKHLLLHGNADTRLFLLSYLSEE